ncbi:hypothetical protein B0T11DRAFT_86006 [Plectosphaerella cucumerina]|uniref:Secreted protein n=1 Tax=Plectosphaerella cucumerina TaxID=40658 RepID=A0A8K0TDJ1_9PEZI|nr:hypothetical protein B0T11DRAFT_86006 [Plectosphaerella cucumerina]
MARDANVVLLVFFSTATAPVPAVERLSLINHQPNARQKGVVARLQTRPIMSSIAMKSQIHQTCSIIGVEAPKENGICARVKASRGRAMWKRREL